MPRELSDYIGGWARRATQRLQRGPAYRRHARGEDWDTIMAEIMR